MRKRKVEHSYDDDDDDDGDDDDDHNDDAYDGDEVDDDDDDDDDDEVVDGDDEYYISSIGFCKITLEVLSSNHPAKQLYAGAGFAPYELDPMAGHALFWQKKIQN